MTDRTDIDNVRYSLDTQEFFQRQLKKLLTYWLMKKILKTIKHLLGS
jgi:hypothetical protein